MDNNEKFTRQIITAINDKFGGPNAFLTRQHLREEFADLVSDIRSTIQKANRPDYVDVTVGPQPYVIDYKNYKHIFLWAITNFTATIGEYGSFTFTAGNWYNIGFRQGLKITATNPTQVNAFIKLTDEIVP